MNLDDLLERIHIKLAETHQKALDSGECTPKELEEIRKFLADNGIKANLLNKKGPIHKLTASMPFVDETQVG